MELLSHAQGKLVVVCCALFVTVWCKVEGGVLNCEVRGYLLSNRKVMFVDIGEREFVPDQEELETDAEFDYEDWNLLSLEPISYFLDN